MTFRSAGLARSGPRAAPRVGAALFVVFAALAPRPSGSLSSAGCRAPSRDRADGAGERETSEGGSTASLDAADDGAAARGRSPARAAEAVGEEAASARVGMATVELLGAGKPPKRLLRYAWRVDQAELLSMDLRAAASEGSGEGRPPAVPLPIVHVSIAIHPTDVSADGDLGYRWQVKSATVDGARDTPPPVLEHMRAEVAEIARLTGSARVTSRGLTRDVSVDHAVSEREEAGGSPAAPPAIADPAGADPGTDPGADGPMNEQVRQTLRDLAAPMPEEAVGVGARWRKNSVVDTRSARIAQTETFRLVDLHGDKGSLDDVLAQHGPPAAEGTVERENGADPARIESILASGDAKVRFDLSRLVPQTLFDGTTSLTVSGPSPGTAASARAMTMIMHVAIAGTRP